MFLVEKLGQDVWVAMEWEEGGETFRRVGRREELSELACVVTYEEEFSNKKDAEEALAE